MDQNVKAILGEDGGNGLSTLSLSQKDSKNTSLLKAALLYAAKMGWAVFPVWWPKETGATPKCACGKDTCTQIGKHPIGTVAPHGCHSASKDPDTIKRWWKEYPQAN